MTDRHNDTSARDETLSGQKCRVNEILFRKPACTYSEGTPGYVNIGEAERIAVIQSGCEHARMALLYCHGNGEDIYECVRSAVMCDFIPPDVAFAAVAYPGYGLSEGVQSEAGCYRNAHRLYEWMRTDMGFAPKDIIVVGYSLGTGVAIELANACPVRAVMLLAPFVSGRRLIEYWDPALGGVLSPELEAFPSIHRVGNVTCPVAVIHGEKDNVVPFMQGEELYEAVQVKAGFFAVPSAGHGNLFAALGPSRYKEIVQSLFLKPTACNNGVDA